MLVSIQNSFNQVMQIGRGCVRYMYVETSVHQIVCEKYLIFFPNKYFVLSFGRKQCVINITPNKNELNQIKYYTHTI